MLIAIVLDRPLAEAKALVDDPAAFTQEMTRILREKQSLAQMMKPTEISDPPPANAAFSSSGSRDESYTGQSVQFQKLLELTWGTHGWHAISLLRPWF